MEKVNLFGLDKSGGYKVWSIHTEADKVVIVHGKEGGKLQTKVDSVKGKNIGRSNETTAEQQAEFEAKSRINKQIDKGYRETVEELDNLEISVMLAHDYLKQGHRIAYPCFGSPKLDGVRCLAIRKMSGIDLLSRGGKSYSVSHIQQQLEKLMKVGDIFDGELYIHGLYLEEIVSAVKKYNSNTPKLNFVIFDKVTQESYEHRLISMQALRQYTLSCVEAPNIDVIKFCKLQDENHMKQVHHTYIQDGYEGIMLRNFNGKYESGKRSADLQKYKEFKDEEFQIVGVLEDRNGNAVFECFDTLADAKFTVTYGDFEQRKYQLENPKEYIGNMLTVKYQARYKDSLLPQFPTGVVIRSYE